MDVHVSHFDIADSDDFSTHLLGVCTLFFMGNGKGVGNF